MPRTAQSAVRGVVIGPVTPGAWPGYIGPHRPATPGRTPSARISTRRGALRPATVSAWPPPHTPGHGLGPATGDDRPATASALRQVTTDRPRPARRSPPSASGPGRSGPPRPCAGSAGPPLAAQARPPGPQTLGAVSARALALRRPAGGAICNGTRRRPRRSAASKGRLLCPSVGAVAPTPAYNRRYARSKSAHNSAVICNSRPKRTGAENGHEYERERPAPAPAPRRASPCRHCAASRSATALASQLSTRGVIGAGRGAGG